MTAIAPRVTVGGELFFGLAQQRPQPGPGPAPVTPSTASRTRDRAAREVVAELLEQRQALRGGLGAPRAGVHQARAGTFHHGDRLQRAGPRSRAAAARPASSRDKTSRPSRWRPRCQNRPRAPAVLECGVEVPARAAEPRQRGADVGLLVAQPLQRLPLPVAAQLRPRRPRRRRGSSPRGVASRPRLLTGSAELFGGVLAQRLQHPVPASVRRARRRPWTARRAGRRCRAPRRRGCSASLTTASAASASIRPGRRRAGRTRAARAR